MTEPGGLGESNPFASPQAEMVNEPAPHRAPPPPIVAAGLFLGATDLIVCPLRAIVFIESRQYLLIGAVDLAMYAPWRMLIRFAELGLIAFSLAAAFALLARKPWAVRFGYAAAACTALSIVDQMVMIYRRNADGGAWQVLRDFEIVDVLGSVVMRAVMLGIYVAMLRRFPGYLLGREVAHDQDADHAGSSGK